MSTEPLAGSLLALQTRMTAYLLQPDAEALTALPDVQAPITSSDADGNGAPSASPMSALRRLGVYHGAYRARLLETLRDTYGHTLRLLGDDAFDALALAYIAQSPSTHRNLRWYGETWPDFLVDAAVAELARLDWALREAFDGPDDTVLGLRDLQLLAPDAWAVVRLRPHATVRRLAMRHNTLQRWHALDDERPVPDAEPLPAPGWVLVWRRDDRPHFRSMAAPEAWAVRQLLAGQPWVALCEGLAEAWPDQDATTLAAQCLRRWVDEDVLAEAVMGPVNTA
ncbi:DNA-binding domain-containing protein [Aquabacterium sp.]|uniref:HvfC/BufC N-terminal domain-containing protein n=1 Tax=Aquabacterium sp. TaxID=1872578 RepID=UPI002488DCCD|nr:DNA-binding domain-containing protein [Aquabacterium sp.]MDI1348559.1 DNA-binding domain-containing protein [Aquabacterium sp.]